MKFFNLALLFLVLSYFTKIVESKDCTYEDIRSYFTKCDFNNKRKGKIIILTF
jgi:hypothetical protein